MILLNNFSPKVIFELNIRFYFDSVWKLTDNWLPIFSYLQKGTHIDMPDIFRVKAYLSVMSVS